MLLDFVLVLGHLHILNKVTTGMRLDFQQLKEQVPIYWSCILKLRTPSVTYSLKLKLTLRAERDIHIKMSEL
jgi:hypothetical protein